MFIMKTSIITISYNSEKTIEQTISSVISQPVSDLEYIIVDAVSTDKTLEIIDKYKDERFKIISEKDGGISDAFNKGINLATGEIIGIINSDDILLPTALVEVEDVFRSYPEVDVVHGNVIRFTNSINDGYEAKPCTDLEHMRYKFLINHPATFVRKSAYEKYGLYSLEYKCAMDYELISKMYFSGARFFYIDKALTAFREGGISDTKISQTLKEHKKIALRNGAPKIQCAIYVLKLRIRNIVLKTLKFLNIEKKLREKIKKQYLPESISCE